MAGFAEELRRIPMSQGLGATLARAADYAQAQQHGEVALEHLLLALTEDDDATQVLAASHVDLALLKADVSSYLGGLDQRVGDGDPGKTALAIDLKRILEAAAAAASQGRRREINGAIVLAAIVGDGRSSAAHMLRAQGLTFEEAIKALQRAISGAPQPVAVAAPSASVAKADAEDILATARARVQTRAAPGLPPRVEMPVAVAAVEEVAQPVSRVAAEAVEVAPWPPEVRRAEPAEAVRSEPRFAAPDFDSIQREINEAREAEDADTEEAAAAQAYEQAGFDEPAQAMPVEPVRYPEPPILPPPMQASAGLQPPPLRPMPQPGSRWPAPVAPAWRDQPVTGPIAPSPAPDHAMPPPLPPTMPAPLPPLHTPQAEWTAHDEPLGWADVRGQYGGVTSPPVPAPPPMDVWPGEHRQEGPPLHHQREFEPGHDEQSGWPERIEPVPHMQPPPPPQHWGPPPSAPELTGLAHVVHGNDQSGQTAMPARRRKSADRALAAHLAEGLPRRMTANAATTVDVRLSQAEIASLLDGLAEESGRHPALGSLSVKLSAPEGRFLIEPMSPETHWREHDGALAADGAGVSWRWTVTALKPGRRRMQLAVWARSASPDGTAVVTPLPDQIVEVRVGRDYGRAFGRMLTWVVLMGAGWLAATYGGAIYGPVMAEMAKLLK